MKVEEYLGLENTLGHDIWNHKYRYQEETFDEWVTRVSGDDEEVGNLIYNKKFLFAGRILANRGLNKFGKKVTYSNCYVVSPPEDNIESIFDTAKALARTYSYGGGCGVDIGKLRPLGSEVHNAAESTSGAVSFMNLYSQVTELIGQSGRRGALMITIPVNHPDLESFIDIKSDLTKVTKANISIRITNEFMEAVENHEKFMLTFDVEDTGEKIEKEVDAYEIFCKISDMNWDYAEPGMLFWDRIENWNLLSNTEEFEFAGTNPCAEEPLPAGGSCLLGAINLSEYLKIEKDEEDLETSSFDFDTFSEDVKVCVKALNDVLDEGLPLHPLQEQRDSVRDWRQIGLGVLGIADLMIKLGVRYGSDEGVELCEQIGKTMADSAIYQSATLAKEQGAYPKCNIDEVMTTPYFVENASEETVAYVTEVGGLRNSQLLTIAPTGTISTMLGISGGIEPIYSNSYTRKTESLHGEDVFYKVYTPIVQEYMTEYDLAEEEELPEFFVTAQTLDYTERIKMQAAWQRHIDASISSTVNVPKEFSKEEVRGLYFKAWKEGLKGITIFRDGCKRLGILTTGTEADSKKELKRGDIVKVSDSCVGKRRTLHTGCGTLHTEAFFDPNTGELREVFLSKGSKGGCNSFMVGLSRMISLAARGGIGIEKIVDQLESTLVCSSYAVRTATKHDTSPGSSCPMSIGKALTNMYNEMHEELVAKGVNFDADGEEAEVVNVDPKLPEDSEKADGANVINPCPICGAELTFEGGCNTCKSCGYSKCE
jgi:ribonucleoside-diphosphate reductase alpha chain